MSGGRARERRSLLRVIVACLCSLVLVALLTYGLVSKAPNTSIAEGLDQGQPTAAPGFELELLEPREDDSRLRSLWGDAAADGQIGLRELRGTPVVVNFWASWCAPCRQEAALLQSTWEEARRQGVLFLGINMQDARSDARTFIEEFNLTYPTVREPARETAEAYGATGIPETYFLTADGRVAGRHIGPIEADELRAGIRAARTGRVAGAQADVPTPELRLVPVKPNQPGSGGRGGGAEAR